MADTTNYGWTKPTVGGDTGAWGTILNTLFDDIDADVKAIADSIANGLGDFVIGGAAGHEAMTSAASQPQWFFTQANGRYSSFGANVNTLYFKLPPLPVGQKLDAIRSYGHATGGLTVAVALVRYALDGTRTVVSSGHSLPGAGAETETAAIAHVILADNDYFIEVDQNAGTTGDIFVKGVGYTVIAA